jgi:hypothetical protein
MMEDPLLKGSREKIVPVMKEGPFLRGYGLVEPKNNATAKPKRAGLRYNGCSTAWFTI